MMMWWKSITFALQFRVRAKIHPQPQIRRIDLLRDFLFPAAAAWYLFAKKTSTYGNK